jgi:hypothetical protein
MPSCTSCQRDNEGWRRHCGGCGGQLVGACGACGIGNGPTDKFCGGCGHALTRASALPPPPPPRRRPRTSIMAPMDSHTVPIEMITDAILAEYTAPISVAKSGQIQAAPGPGKKKHKKKRR